MKKPLSLLALVSTVALSQAQITPFEVGIGYGQSGRFTKESGGRDRLEGPELSLSQAILKLPFVGEAKIGVSALFGGGLSSGNDADGNVYRFFVRYKSPALGPSGIYVLVGGHWATAEGRGDSFDRVSRAGADFGLGMGFGPSVPGLPRAALELMSHQNRKAQLEGLSLSLKLRL